MDLDSVGNVLRSVTGKAETSGGVRSSVSASVNVSISVEK